MGITNTDQRKKNINLFSSLEILLKTAASWRSKCYSKSQIKSRRCGRRILMKRRMRLDRSIRSRVDAIQSKVRTLKKLIPNCESTSDHEMVLKETAEYIMTLQMRVKLMQVMVDLLSSGSDDYDGE